MFPASHKFYETFESKIAFIETKTGFKIVDENNIEHDEYVKAINFGSLPNSVNTLKSIPHNIPNCIFTSVTGIVNGNGNSFNIPYASYTTADIVRYFVDSTNINIGCGKDRSMYTAICYIKYYKL